MRSLDTCLVCQHTTFTPVHTCRDHTVSGESFPVVRCANCGFTFTNPVPAEEAIGPYYKSEQYVSHTNTRKGIVNWLYQQVKGRTLKRKARYIEHLSGRTNGTVLDVGCGTGDFLGTLKQRGWTCLGLEPDPDARQLAQRNHGLDVRPTDALWELPAQVYDVITLWHVLEHVHRLHEYLAQLHNLLKPGGVLIIAVPNHTCHDADHYGADWAAWDVPRHLYHFHAEALTRLAAQHGLQVQAMTLMPFDAYYVSLLSEKIRTGKTGLGALWRAFWVGRRSNTAARRNVHRSSSIQYTLRLQ